MAKQPHGKVRVQRPGDEKARTIPATLWALPGNAFQKQGYELVAEQPIGVEPIKPAKKPAKKEKQFEADEQPEINVEES